MKVSVKQGGLRKGSGCVDQIFAMKRLVEEYLGKNENLYYAAFMDLENAYDKVDREALSVMKIYGVSGQLLRGYRLFIERQMHV